MGDALAPNREASHHSDRGGKRLGRKLLVGRGSLRSTPAVSAVIRRKEAVGGLVLSASHNPGGIDEDFGIKYNVRNGGPAPETVTEAIYQETMRIKEYLIFDNAETNIDIEGSTRIGSTEVVIIDPLVDYCSLMEELFDFPALRKLFASGFRMTFDAMHAITGPYARHLLEEKLGAPLGTASTENRWSIFGGHHQI